MLTERPNFYKTRVYFVLDVITSYSPPWSLINGDGRKLCLAEALALASNEDCNAVSSN